MHELSIALHLVEAASARAVEAGSESVTKVYVRVGALSGVVREALAFSFDVATQHTMLEGATLEVEDVPLVVFCPQCDAEKHLPDRFVLCCPDCDTPTPDIRQGRELEITAIEIQS